MKNEDLKAFISEFGDKIFCIILDNSNKIYIGVSAHSKGNQITTKDLIFKTVGNVDYVGVKHLSRTWGGIEVPYTHWHLTGCIQSIITTDELSSYLPDLNVIE